MITYPSEWAKVEKEFKIPATLRYTPNMLICRKFTFEASHQLPNFPIYGKCSRLHGHSYKLFVYVEGDVSKEGWVCNFSQLKEIVNERVIEKLDHQHLNKVFPNQITTAENLAKWIVEQIMSPIQNETKAMLHHIKLRETENCSVLYYT